GPNTLASWKVLNALLTSPTCLKSRNRSKNICFFSGSMAIRRENGSRRFNLACSPADNWAKLSLCSSRKSLKEIMESTAFSPEFAISSAPNSINWEPSIWMDIFPEPSSMRWISSVRLHDAISPKIRAQRRLWVFFINCGRLYGSVQNDQGPNDTGHPAAKGQK